MHQLQRRRRADGAGADDLILLLAHTFLGLGKRAAVAKLIRDRSLSQALVFTNTKIGAGRLARLLERHGTQVALARSGAEPG